MKSTLLSLAAAAAITAGVAGATPAVAATPGAPVANAIEFKTDGPANGGVVQVRHRGRWGHSRRCRILRYRARYSRYARRLYRRYCLGGRHHVRYRQCRRWYYLGYRRGIARYRYLYRRYCRWYR